MHWNHPVYQTYYLKHAFDIIKPSSEIHDLGVYMSNNSTFDFHVTDLYKRCTNLSDWILISLIFCTNKTRTMMTLFLITGSVLAELYLPFVVTPHININLPNSEANMCKKSVMDPIPHRQHRPICVSVQPVVLNQHLSVDASTL